MICSNCGNVVADASVVCGYCGAALDPTQQAFAQPGAYDGSQQWDAGMDMGYGGQPAQGYDGGLGGQPAQGYGGGYGGYDGQLQPPGAQAGYDAGYGGQPQPGYDAQAQAGYQAEQPPYQEQQPPYQADQAPYQSPQAAYQYDAAQAPGAQPPGAQPPGAQAVPPYSGMPAQPGYGQPQPGGMPAQPGYGAAQAYAAAVPSQTPKKSKTGLIIGIVAAAVLVLAVIGIGGFFLVQSFTANAPEPITMPDPDPKPDPEPTPQPTPKPDPEPKPGSPTSPNAGTGIDPNTLLADFENPYVILDESDIKITIDVGSGEKGDSKYFYEVRCVIENKTNQELRVQFRDVSGNNYTGSSYRVYVEKDYIADNKENKASVYFLPGGNLARFSFSNDDVAGPMTDFKGTISLSDVESLDVIAEYKVTIPEL